LGAHNTARGDGLAQLWQSPVSSHSDIGRMSVVLTRETGFKSEKFDGKPQ